MKIEVHQKNGAAVAVVSSSEVLIKDVPSALDLIMTVKYETGCTDIAISREAVVDAFFTLSTCLAGEILQKFVNYGFRVAIYGDFSGYSSKALKDFIYESNHGRDIFFQPDCEQAVNKLSQTGLTGHSIPFEAGCAPSSSPASSAPSTHAMGAFLTGEGRRSRT